MSWVEPEHGGAEGLVENPDPEEDSDLPARRLHGPGEGDGQDRPEDDLAMAAVDSGEVQASGDGGEPTGINPEAAACGSVEGEEGPRDSVEAEAATLAVGSGEQASGGGPSNPSLGGNVEGVARAGANDTESSRQPERDNAVDMADAAEHVEEDQRRVAEIGNDGMEEDDSFEQDEETAAPECETDVCQDSTSESDRQPLQPCIQAERNLGAALNGNNDEAPLSSTVEHGEGSENPELASVDPPGATAAANSDMGTYSGNVEVSDSAEDAPEAELDNLQSNPLAFREAGSPGISRTVQDSDALVPPSTQAADPEGHQLATDGSNSSHSNPGRSPGTSEDHDMQAPECDRGNSPQPSLLHPTNGETAQVQAASHDQPSSDDPVASNNPQQQEAIAPMPTNMCQQQQSTSDPSFNGTTPNQVSVQDLAQALEDNLQTVAESTTGVETEKRASGLPDSQSCEPETLSEENASKLRDSRAGESKSSEQCAASEVIPQTSRLIEPPSLRQSDPSSEQSSSKTKSPEASAAVGDQSSSPAKIATSSEVDVKPPLKLSGTSPPSTLVTCAAASAAQHQDEKGGSQRYPSNSSSSSSSNTSQRASPAKAVAAALFHVMGMDSKFTGKDLAMALQSDDEDDLMSELDAELLTASASSAPRPKLPPKQEHHDHSRRHHKPKSKAEPKSNPSPVANGLPSSRDVLQLQEHNRQLLEQLRIRDEEIARLSKEQKPDIQSDQTPTEKSFSSHSPDDLYLPQIKELERTIAQQGAEIKNLTEKLYTHDAAAKRTVLSLQNEMKARVDQATKMYEDCRREKDTMVVKFAAAEAKNMEAKKISEKSETKVRDAFRDRDNMASALKAAKVDRQRAIANYDGKCAEVANVHKELEKMKEAVSSAEYRIKWFQNKLKDELEAHKETKGNVEKTNLRLKEAREETELIRKECQAIVKRYQESEEIKSNSLEKDLKLKESELQTHLQERNDSEELHQMLQQELESLKSQHKDTLEEAKTLRDKVKCLEDEKQQNHNMIENYQEIMQKQKSDNTDLTARLNSLANLDDDFKRAQNMIESLDKDISDLKVTNRDLQKDMDSCRERESKMLTLQSELSRANAMLRSENTNLSNKATTLGSELDMLKMQSQQLEQQVGELTASLEKQTEKHTENTDHLVQSLSQKTKESSDFKQKWEDEKDNSKTLKRRHANNIKDLTRQLQQARRKLEAHEGKGDNGSMGSRTNSNGSLNSVDNSQHPQHNHHVQAPPLAPPQEFPVIKEQVEVDKNVLIEKIVRLQKSHARKNEKLEFLGEHIQQLLEEIKKKTKIIQTYALREESGTLSSDDMDAHKTLLARKGGIMASMYSVHQQDGSMTLELSLQINKKLQAVLEDTLLKNITLKENLDTLGEEIARLSQENRRLQLHLQKLEKRPH